MEPVLRLLPFFRSYEHRSLILSLIVPLAKLEPVDTSASHQGLVHTFNILRTPKLDAANMPLLSIVRSVPSTSLKPIEKHYMLEVLPFVIFVVRISKALPPLVSLSSRDMGSLRHRLSVNRWLVKPGIRRVRPSERDIRLSSNIESSGCWSEQGSLLGRSYIGYAPIVGFQR